MLSDRVTNTIAAGAATSPWWLPWLREVSEVAGLLLPIAGLLWLLYQFVLKLREKPKSGP